MVAFAERLKELRKAKGITQKALGELVGSSESGIQSYELENRKPTLDVINSLADFFGVTTDYLLGRTDYWIDTDGNQVTAPPTHTPDSDTGKQE